MPPADGPFTPRPAEHALVADAATPWPILRRLLAWAVAERSSTPEQGVDRRSSLTASDRHLSAFLKLADESLTLLLGPPLPYVARG